MSTGTYSLVKTVVTGETITAADRNAEHTNHITHAEPDGIGCHSDNLTEMRATTDPYPGASPSLATALAGEIERLRYLIAQITGETYWYVDPDYAITGLLPGPAGTKAWFYQDTAPTGWTLDATPSDELLAVKGGATYTTGGAQAGTWTQPNHIHAGPSHVHSGPSHTHPYAAHSHALLTEVQTVSGGFTNWIGLVGDYIQVSSGGGGSINAVKYLTNESPAGNTDAGGTGDTGAAGTGATGGGATANTYRPLARVGIICSRN